MNVDTNQQKKIRVKIGREKRRLIFFKSLQDAQAMNYIKTNIKFLQTRLKLLK